MAKDYTRQTPRAMRDWLSEQSLAFPANWTLDAVAEECHRRYLAGRWQGGESEASRAVVVWAATKLTTWPDFTAQHWEWIAAPDKYGRAEGYSRLSEIMQPAVAAVPTWRQSEAQRDEALKKMNNAASYLLQIIESSHNLNVSLRGVVGWAPEFQPLYDHSRKIQSAETDRSLERARTARKAGASLDTVISASLPLDGYREPRLSDYLLTFQAALRGTLSEPSHLLHGLTSEEEAVLSQRFGMTLRRVDPKNALRTGGDFGTYPNRNDALRRAVILAFPRAIYERITAPPKVTAASMIEAACFAWFGSAPSQKEINAAIKPARNELEPRMRSDVNSRRKDAERTAKWKAAGLSDAEIQQRRFLSSLEPDDDALADVKKKALSRLKGSMNSRASKTVNGKKAGNLPQKK